MRERVQGFPLIPSVTLPSRPIPCLPSHPHPTPSYLSHPVHPLTTRTLPFYSHPTSLIASMTMPTPACHSRVSLIHRCFGVCLVQGVCAHSPSSLPCSTSSNTTSSPSTTTSPRIAFCSIPQYQHRRQHRRQHQSAWRWQHQRRWVVRWRVVGVGKWEAG